MAFQFEIVESQPQPALAVRTTVPVERLGEEIGKAYQMVIDHLTAIDEPPLGPAFVGYHSMDMAALDVEIGFPVAHEVAGSGTVVATHIPGGRRAVTFHKGPYDAVAATYEALGAWVVDKGEQPTGIAYEFYFNAPGEVPESELLTRIELLLA